jgi:hypothetical protein
MRQLGSTVDGLGVKHFTDLLVGGVDSGEGGGKSGDERDGEVHDVGMVQKNRTMSSGRDNCEHGGVDRDLTVRARGNIRK